MDGPRKSPSPRNHSPHADDPASRDRVKSSLQGDDEDFARCLDEIDTRLDLIDCQGPADDRGDGTASHPGATGAPSPDEAVEDYAKLLAADPQSSDAAKLLEECRRVNPPQSPLLSVVVRDDGAARRGGSEQTRPSALGRNGLDLIADEEEATIPLAGKVPLGEPRRGFEGLASDTDSTAGPSIGPSVEEPEEVGLTLASSSVPRFAAAGTEEDPAAQALRRRVTELLRQARAAAAQGHNEEALALLSRLLILDEQHEEALVLEREIRHAAGEAARSVDDWLSEGIQLLSSGKIEESRQLFLQVLERAPEHREALDYLERADAMLAVHEQTEASRAESARRVATKPDAGAAAEPRGRVWEPPRGKKESDPAREEPPPPEPAATEGTQLLDLPSADLLPLEIPAVAPAAARLARPRMSRVLSIATIGVTVLMAGGAAAWWLLYGSASPSIPEAPPPVARSTKPGGNDAATRTAPGERTDPGAPRTLSAEERTRLLAEALAGADRAFAARQFEAAVLAYNEVLRLDPENAAARSRLLEAGELYRKVKEEGEQLDRARRAFAAGEYESALRLFYRVPDGTVDSAVLTRYKANGWYNLGVVALRAADCTQAASHLSEASTLAPADPGIRQARQLAETCPQQRKDRVYYERVESLAFRDLGD